MQTAAQVDTRVADGHAALDRGDWDAARAAFEAAAEREPGHGAALQGAALAAFFTDDPVAVPDLRERAYRAAGDARAAGRVAVGPAWNHDQQGHGDAVAAGLAGARAPPARRPACGPRAGWLALREASRELPGDAAAARDRCAGAERLGRDLGDLDLEPTARALGGLARVSLGDVTDGLRMLDEAAAAASAGEMRDRVAAGIARPRGHASARPRSCGRWAARRPRATRPSPGAPRWRRSGPTGPEAGPRASARCSGSSPAA